MQIIEAKLCALRESKYTVYVFQDVINEEYIMCTRLPNWNIPKINIGDIGFLQYQIVKSGDEYFNPSTGETDKFNYSNIYFNNFILKSDVVNNQELIL